MAKAGQISTIKRVLIALDAPLEDQQLLEIAIALAAARQVELVTLFIEDQELFHLAALPFAQEIDRTSARERKLDALQVARTLRSQARDLGRMLERLTRQPRVSHSLRIVRGAYMNTVLSAVTGMDVVFLRKEIGSYKQRPRGRPFDWMAPVTRQQGKHKAVWTLFNGSAGCARALLTACEIAHADQRDLVIVLQAADSGGAAELRRQADALVADQALKALYTFAPGTDDMALARLLDSGACGLVVMHRDTGSESDTLTRLLLRELECPLALVP